MAQEVPMGRKREMKESTDKGSDKVCLILTFFPRTDLEYFRHLPRMHLNALYFPHHY